MLLFERLALFEKYFSHQNILNPRSHAGLSVLNTVPYIKKTTIIRSIIYGEGNFVATFGVNKPPYSHAQDSEL